MSLLAFKFGYGRLLSVILASPPWDPGGSMIELELPLSEIFI